jgi:hypothetical protein
MAAGSRSWKPFMTFAYGCKQKTTEGTVLERPELEFLAVGSSGCNGLEWGYRKGHRGLWVCYPIEQFESLGPTLAELFDGWYSGRIRV